MKASAPESLVITRVLSLLQAVRTPANEMAHAAVMDECERSTRGILLRALASHDLKRSKTGPATNPPVPAVPRRPRGRHGREFRYDVKGLRLSSSCVKLGAMIELGRNQRGLSA